MKSNNKTVPSESSVAEYLSTITDMGRKQEAKLLLELISQSTKAKPVMWGTNIIGFGTHHYQYDSGREGDIGQLASLLASKHWLFTVSELTKTRPYFSD